MHIDGHIISRFTTATNMTGSRNPWRRYAAISWENLGPELNRSGFAGSVAVQARQSLEETRWLLELGSDARTGTNLNPMAARPGLHQERGLRLE